VCKLTNSPDLNGKTVAIAWKRGNALHAGSTKDAVVENGEATWNEKIIIKGTLFRDADSDKFDEKLVALTLKQDTRVFAKQTIDLGHYTKNEHTHTEEILLSKKPQHLILRITIHTRWLKLNGKLLVKADENSVGREKVGVEIDGQAYGLRTDDALTDTSIDTGTGSWDEEDDMRDDPFTTTTMYEAESRRSNDELEALRKQLRLVEGESAQRAKTIELQEKAIFELRNQLEITEKKCVESEELIQRGYELESFMRQQVALAQQEHKDDLDALRSAHSTEVSLLRKELDTERTRAQNSTFVTTPTSDHSSSTQDAAVVGDIEVLEQERVTLKAKVDSLEEELQHSSLSLVNMTNKLSGKDVRIESLLAQVNALQLQVDNRELLTNDTAPKHRPPHASEFRGQHIQPLFANPVLNEHHKLIVLFGYLSFLFIYNVLV
jgi:hypothetical protein